MLLTEKAATSATLNVDEENGVILNSKLLGKTSVNGREYDDRAMQEAVSLYDGRKVYVNHPKRSELGEDRQFESWAGVVRNPRYKNGSIYGDIHLRKESPHYRGIIEAATKFPGSFGCSHVADGDSVWRGNVEVVTRISRVDSVDIVTDPATTKGLYESSPYAAVKNGPGNSSATSPLDIIEHEVDSFIIDVLGQVTLAWHYGKPTSLPELSARLHVLANECRRFAGGTPDIADENAYKFTNLGNVVDELDAVLLDPAQTGAVNIVEPLLIKFGDAIKAIAQAGKGCGGETMPEPCDDDHDAELFNGPRSTVATQSNGGPFDESRPPVWQPWMEKRLDPFDAQFAAKIRERDRFNRYFHSPSRN